MSERRGRSPGWRRVRGAAAAALAALAAACGEAVTPLPTPPNIVLIVVDTLRADHLGAYGYPRPTSPNIDALARDGILFTRAVAPSSWTKPSVGSLFTSRLPSEHGAIDFDHHLRPGIPTLATLLADAGYRTVGVSANFVHVNRHSGMARGFEAWNAKAVRKVEGEEEIFWTFEDAEGEEIHFRERHAGEVNRTVFRMLKHPGPRPLFLYVHYMEPHSSYLPPAEFREAFVTDPAAHGDRVSATTDYLLELLRTGAPVSGAEHQRLVDLYDAEIAAVDAAIGELLAELRRRGYWENTVLALVSDHGEEFGEHGGWFHGVNLHAESLRVPFLIRDARRAGPGLRGDEPVDLLDVPTTLLHLAGVSARPGMRGRALLDPDEHRRRILVAELHPDAWFEENRRPRKHRLSAISWPWKALLLRDGSRALYQLEEDPAESVELDAERIPPPLARILTRRGESFPAEPAPPGEPLDPEYREQLRALGYVE